MTKCKECGVPLDGPLSFIPKLFFGVKPSLAAPGHCNKCEDMYLVRISQKSTIKASPIKKKAKKR